MSLFDNMLSRYTIVTENDLRNATHEVMQEITLAGLYRGVFFDKAAFYGGTCLRIFHNLARCLIDMNQIHDAQKILNDQSSRMQDFIKSIDLYLRVTVTGSGIKLNKELIKI